MADSLKDAFVNSGHVSKSDADKRVKDLKDKERKRKAYQKRKKKSRFMSKFSVNRLGERVAYADWMFHKTVHQNKKECCATCGAKVTELSSVSLFIDDELSEIKTITEKELIEYLHTHDTWRLKYFKNYLNVPDHIGIQYFIEKYDLDGLMCLKCFVHYVINKFYPNHIPSKKGKGKGNANAPKKDIKKD